MRLKGHLIDGTPYDVDLGSFESEVEQRALFELRPVPASLLGAGTDGMAKISTADATSRERIARERFFMDRMKREDSWPVPYLGAGDSDAPHVITELRPDYISAGKFFGDPEGHQHLYGGPSDLPALAEAITAVIRDLHRLGICHCDIAPGNILLHRIPGGGGAYAARLIDLAHAHSRPGWLQEPAATAEGTRGITKGWASPDRIRGAVTVESDMYGVALTVLAFANGSPDPLSGAQTQDAIAAMLPGQLSLFAREVQDPDVPVRRFVERILLQPDVDAERALQILSGEDPADDRRPSASQRGSAEVPTLPVEPEREVATEIVAVAADPAVDAGIAEALGAAGDLVDWTGALHHGAKAYDKLMLEVEAARPRPVPVAPPPAPARAPEEPLVDRFGSSSDGITRQLWPVAVAVLGLGLGALVLIIAAVLMGRL